MINTRVDGLMSLKPSAEFVWTGTDYSGLNWLDSGSAPTESEIDAEVTRLNNLEPMRLLRILRNSKLAETDWMSFADSPTMSDDWKTYRQALRDLPANTEDPSNPTYPTKPE